MLSNCSNGLSQNRCQTPHDLAEVIQEADESIKEKEELLSTLTNEQAKVRNEMDRIYRLYIDEQLTSRGFGERYNPLEERVTQLEDEIPRLQADIDFLKINLLSSDEILHEAQDLYSRWPNLEHEEKRQIVENITEQIVIGRDDVTIHLCYLPVASELMTKGPQNNPGSSR